MNVNELSSRVERLERENRMMKRTGLAVVGLALAVALIGAATPNEIPEVIEARSFRVIDENGKFRAGMSADGIVYIDENLKIRAAIKAAGIGYFDENGTPRAMLSADGIRYFDENLMLRAVMDADSIVYLDAKGTTRAGMDADGITYLDENGKTRAQLGLVETVSEKTQKESRYPAGVALFDDDGDMIWMAPQ